MCFVQCLVYHTFLNKCHLSSSPSEKIMCQHLLNSGVPLNMRDVILTQADILVERRGSKQRFVKGSQCPSPEDSCPVLVWFPPLQREASPMVSWLCFLSPPLPRPDPMFPQNSVLQEACALVQFHLHLPPSPPPRRWA